MGLKFRSNRVTVRKESNGYAVNFKGRVIGRESKKSDARKRAVNIRRQIANGAPV